MNFPTLDPISCLKVSIKGSQSNHHRNDLLGYFLKVFLVDGLVLFHLVEGEMVRQLGDLSLGHILVQEPAHLPDDGRQVSLHLLKCEEENVLLFPPAPVTEDVGDEGAVVAGHVLNKGAEENLKSS